MVVTSRKRPVPPPSQLASQLVQRPGDLVLLDGGQGGRGAPAATHMVNHQSCLDHTGEIHDEPAQRGDDVRHHNG